MLNRDLKWPVLFAGFKIDCNKLKFTAITLVFITTIFILATANIAFWRALNHVYPWTNNFLFIISLVVFIGSVMMVVQILLCLLLPVRIVVSTMLILSSITAYFSDRFGVVVDVEMIRNSVQTSFSEAWDLLTGLLILRVFLFAVVPTIIIWLVPFQQEVFIKHLRKLIFTAGGLFILSVLCIVSCSAQYASFFREHKTLRYYINPIYPLYSLRKFLVQSIPAAQTAFQERYENAKVPVTDLHKELIIMVVGETARADHFSLNGYSRITNPNLEKEASLISYTNMLSCGTSTAISVPCMFSFSGRKNFSITQADHTENVLDVLYKAGVSVLWRDNNSSSKGVANRIEYQNFKTAELNSHCQVTECRDLGMLEGLQGYIDKQSGDVLIVLHQMGSHGPAYYKRYPKEFEQFKPACQSIELGQCTQAEIINAYDNTILYTDYFLSKIIKLLKSNTPTFETAMLYISDHGESLGEKNLYLHGLPYFFAPAEQKHVAALLWVGSSSDIDFERTQLFKHNELSHDVISESLLKLFEIDTKPAITRKYDQLLFDVKAEI